MNNLVSLVKYPLVWIVFSALYSFNAIATEKDILVSEGHVRATIPGTSISAAYMRIKNLTTSNLILIGASSEVSNRIEIHEHVMTGDMMKMQQRQSLSISPNHEVVLQPSGYHLMIFNLIEPLKDNTEISLTLHFSDNVDIDVTLPVKGINRSSKQKSTHHHHH